MKQNTKTLSDKKLSRILKAVHEIAFDVGHYQVKHQKKIGSLKISSKQAQGLVSNVDIESEKKLIKKLKVLIPEASFLAEESAFLKYGNEKSKFLEFKKEEYSWIIDPLDGTTNYLSGMDYFAICICLTHFGKPILGVVYRPITHELYSAQVGKGAFFYKNGKKKKLELNSKANLKDTLLVTGFACEKGEEFDQEFTLFQKMMKHSRGIRRMGSAALDICHVSQGIFGAFWERGLAPWDVAAASVILSEAGGKLTDYKGKKFNPFQDTIAVSSRRIHKQLLSAINS